MARVRHRLTRAVALLSLLGATLALAGAPASSADFESQLVQDVVAQQDEEAVDLSGATLATEEMRSMLNWAIAHSDPEALRQKAEQVRRDEVVAEFQARQQRVKELSDLASQQPTEAQLMQEQIAVLLDERVSAEGRAAALQVLQQLVEPIDAANDLRVLGGLQPLVALLHAGQPPELQARAAAVLGTALSNNQQLAEQLLQAHPEVLALLLQVAAAPQHEEAASKAMFALGRLVAGPAPAARTAFYNSGGLAKLQALLARAAGAGKRVKARAVNLISDLIALTSTGDDASVDTWNAAALDAMAGAALDVLQQSEAMEAKEKALLALRTLLTQRGAAGAGALEAHGAEAVLREELTSLDLAAAQLADEASAAEAAAEAAAAAAAKQSAAGEAAGEAEQQVMHDAEVASHAHQFAEYVGHLCADVLHHLSVHHSEL